MKTKIELTRLRADDAIMYSCSEKQLNFICDLMARRKMFNLFKHLFCIDGKARTYRITKLNAKKLITALLNGEEFEFKEKEVLPEMKEGKLKVKYKPTPKLEILDVEKKLYEQLYTEIEPEI